MLELELESETGDDTMARKVADDLLVTTYVRRLRATGHDRALFDRLLLEIRGDKHVGVAEAVSIAAQYSGKRFKTRKDALEGLAKRFVDLVRTSARLEIAAKERIM